jgi:hypothetical protein
MGILITQIILWNSAMCFTLILYDFAMFFEREVIYKILGTTLTQKEIQITFGSCSTQRDKDPEICV